MPNVVERLILTTLGALIATTIGYIVLKILSRGKKEEVLVRKALSEKCRTLRYTLADWQQEDRALKNNADSSPCPCCERRGFYAPRADKGSRHHRACKFCGFWQDVGEPPHEIIRYECSGPNGHWVADWKEPHESWTCKLCGTHFNPTGAVAWPADDPSHWWHEAPDRGTQQDYRNFWSTRGIQVGPFGIP